MALADIIEAIKVKQEHDIALLQEQELRKKNEIKHKADKEISEYQENMQNLTESKKRQLKKKAETMVRMERRKLLLQEKRKAIDSVYNEIIEDVSKLPTDKLKNLEKSLEQKVAGRSGEKKTAKEGGFIFISKNTEEDFSFPHLVQTVLRSQTELDVSAKLFS